MSIPFLAYAAAVSTLFPVVIGVIRFREIAPEFKMLLIVYSMEVLNAFLQFALSFQGKNNLFLAHYYLLFEFTLLLWVFSHWTAGKWTTVFKVTLVFFVVVWIFAHIVLESFDQPAYYTSFLSKVLYTGISIVLLHKISAASEKSIIRDPRFWILSGLLIFATGGIMFSFLRSVIDRLPLEGLLIAYSIHWAISIVTNMMYAIGFLCKPQLQNSGGQLELAR